MGIITNVESLVKRVVKNTEREGDQELFIAIDKLKEKFESIYKSAESKVWTIDEMSHVTDLVQIIEKTLDKEEGKE